MKRIYYVTAVFLLLTAVSRAQYLPLTGGTLTGPLTINSGNQLQMSYLGFNNSFSQPSNSGNVSIFANASSGALDLVGWGTGWHFVPSTVGGYPAPVATIDAGGNSFFAGKLGIGTSNPSSAISLSGTNGINPNNTGSEIIYSSLTFQNKNGGNDFLIGRISAVQELGNFVDAGGMSFYTGVAGLNERMRLNTAGNLLIGKSSQINNLYKLDVNGQIRANSITVNTSGADFVFIKGYKLNPLSYVSNYINKNHHLPDMPSAREMQKDGLNLSENQTKLLQKIEELTLYAIKKDEEVRSLKKQINLFEQRLNSLEKNAPPKR